MKAFVVDRYKKNLSTCGLPRSLFQPWVTTTCWWLCTLQVSICLMPRSVTVNSNSFSNMDFR